MRRRQKRVKSGAVVIDLIQDHMAEVARIMADVELAAFRLVACQLEAFSRISGRKASICSRSI